MDNTNTFQIILLAVFGVAALIGVALFAGGFLSPGNSTDQQPVSFSIWGEWDDSTFSNILDQSGVSDIEAITISYTSVPENQLNDRLINSLARGQGPDVLLTSHVNLLRYSDLITTIGENNYTPRRFKNTFTEGSEIFLGPEGITALPIAVDPLVMYWNRDILTEAGFVSPPERWSEVPQYTKQIVTLDSQDNMQTAGIALGSVNNIGHLKEIVSSLFFQVGNDVVITNQDGVYESQLGGSNQSLQSAVNQYGQYSNPSSRSYAWNNSFASDEQAFVSGNLAFYLAPASSIRSIRNQNPNLNFDVTAIPQLEDGVSRTYGDFYGFFIMQRAPNKLAILSALEVLTSTSMAEAISTQTDLVPVRKDVLSAGVSDSYKQTFYESAIISRGWYDPDPETTNEIFATIISDVTSGRRMVGDALQNANTLLRNSIDNVLSE